MKSQIFHKDPDLSILLDLLDDMSHIHLKKYVITPVTYRQAEYHNKIDPFIELIRPHYHVSKQHYLANMNYKRFLTIIRQLCRCLHIYYKSEIKYIGSSYIICYHIYTEPIQLL